MIVSFFAEWKGLPGVDPPYKFSWIWKKAIHGMSEGGGAGGGGGGGRSKKGAWSQSILGLALE